jgi:hypothetical protein
LIEFKKDYNLCQILIYSIALGGCKNGRPLERAARAAGASGL